MTAIRKLFRFFLHVSPVAVAASTTMLWTPPVLAQTAGAAAISGTIRDASTNRPVADAVVTATSPSLQGEQLVVTDATGVYRIQALPPGEYTVRIDKETYRPYSRDGVVLRADTTIQVDIMVLPEAIKEEIVVVGEPPSIDVGSTTTGMNINEDFTRRIPVAHPTGKGGGGRSFESAASVTPGAQNDLYGTSFSGSTSPENQYVVDGLSVNDPGFGINGTPLSIEFIQETNVITGGYMPEYGRTTGGFLNVITQSGSNAYHGSVFTHITPGFMQGNRDQVRREGTTVQTNRSLNFVQDVGFDVGGPVVPDKLWFYGGVMYFATSWNLERSLNRRILVEDPENPGNLIPRVGSDGFVDTARIPGTTKNLTASEYGFQYMGKLDWAPARNDKLSLVIFGVPTFSGGNGSYPILPQQGQPMIGNVTPGNLAGSYNALSMDLDNFANDIVLKYTRAFDNRQTLLDSSLGWHYQSGGRRPVDGSSVGSTSGVAGTPATVWNTPQNIADFEELPDPALCDPQGANGELPCPTASYQTGGPDYISEVTMNRYQGKVMVTRMLQGAGHHVVKAGADIEQMNYSPKIAYSGRRRYWQDDPGGFEYFLEGRQFGFLQGPDDPFVPTAFDWDVNSLTIGGFVQDGWSIVDEVTLNLGVRYDAQIIYNNFGNIGMVVPNQVSPRVGAIYDFTRDGRSKVYGHAARYYESVPLDVAQRTLSGESNVISALAGGACTPPLSQQLRNGQIPSDACRDEARFPINGPDNPNQTYVQSGGTPVVIDPDLDPQSTDEFILGAEYEIFPRGRLGLSYTRRYLHRAIEDMSRDNGTSYFIGNPGHGIAADFPEARREYDAITLYTDKAWRSGWLLHGSYVLSWLRGNYEGLFRATTTQLDPNMNTIFDLTSLTVNTDGPLPGDYRHQIKLFGAKEFEITGRSALTGGMGVRGRSGGPTNYLGAHFIYGQDEIFILPRGSGERLPWQFSVDPHLGYRLGITEGTAVEITADVFNVFNFQATTKVDERFTVAPVSPIENGRRSQVDGVRSSLDGTPLPPNARNSNFGNPVEFQEPLTVRFGARVTF